MCLGSLTDMSSKNAFLPAAIAMSVSVVAVAVLIGISCSGRIFFPPPSPERMFVEKLAGFVDHSCSYEELNAMNEEILYPLLRDLVSRPFFRYYKAKLWCDCPFWPEDGMCVLRDCSVCECPLDEFPEPFKGGDGEALSGQASARQPHNETSSSRASARKPDDDVMCQEGKPQAVVDRTLDTEPFAWTSRDNPWTADDEQDEHGITYVNLLLNPERYTGYTGPSPRRIWDAIYNDNIAVPISKPDILLEAQSGLLYKLISGLHSSISAHIAAEYLLDERKNEWGPNSTLLHDRILKHPDRVRNLYFTFLLVLRAVMKASEHLEHADYHTGIVPDEDEVTADSVVRLVRNSRLCEEACLKLFNEPTLWPGVNVDRLFVSGLQKQFRNITALMDCVGCEKCRLWGKLQLLGLGTALDILFYQDSPKLPLLQRNEVIALFNLLNRLSESLHFLQKLSPVEAPSFENGARFVLKTVI